jgi:hypothetical protein
MNKNTNLCVCAWQTAFFYSVCVFACVCSTLLSSWYWRCPSRARISHISRVRRVLFISAHTAIAEVIVSLLARVWKLIAAVHARHLRVCYRRHALVCWQVTYRTPCTHTHTHTSARTCTHIHTYIHTYPYRHTHVHTYIPTYKCNTYAYIHTYTRTHILVLIHMHTHMRAHVALYKAHPLSFCVCAGCPRQLPLVPGSALTLTAARC